MFNDGLSTHISCIGCQGVLGGKIRDMGSASIYGLEFAVFPLCFGCGSLDLYREFSFHKWNWSNIEVFWVKPRKFK